MNLDDIGWFMMALKECRLVSARLKLYKGMSSLEAPVSERGVWTPWMGGVL